MNAPFAADNLDQMKFAIGQPVRRQEDPILLQGQGRYSDDISYDNQAWCVMVRSQVAHGILKGIDTEEAKAMPKGFDTKRADIERGKVETIEYDSKTVGSKRKVVVYTPPGYSKDNKYPVF